ncbi:MAG: adenylate/guanylate cyclase domain-containing protein [Anaerolineales bacterium]|nr:adenylate/guanylate cyclase domain-containing protein [Anaerolineales bacterium]
MDSPGDNVLAEFTSVVDGVQCAVAVQKELQARNAQLPEDRRMEFRIGINLGDVIEEGDRIYGDGVNIAARLEALADPGGICVSKTAFDQIETKLPLGYEYLGEQPVKNIPKPVGTYRVLMEPRVTVAEEIKKEKAVPLWRRKAVFAGAVAVLVVAVAAAIWNFYLRPPPIEPASVERMALPLPEEPSIAVLPFTNLSGDPEQEYFSDGITEEIITALAKIPQLLVIARNSTFTYKGKPVKVQKVAEDLGVRYVLEGGVRKAGDKIRITAQLIDAISGHHLWAERYDGTLGDVFGLQDKVTEKIVASLAVELTSDQKENVARRGTDNAAAYDAFVQGREYYLRHTRDDMVKAVTYFKRAIELDPNFSSAHAALSIAYTTSRARAWDQDLGWTDARALAEKHLQLAMRNPTPKAHRAAAWNYIWKGQHEKAIAEAERSLTLEPNNALSHHTMGQVLIYAGRSEEGIDFYKKAMRLDPYYPARYLWFLGLAQFCVGQLEEAATSFERARKRNPGLPVWPLAATYAHLGREQEFKDVVAEYMKMRKMSKPPTVKSLLPYFPFKDPKDTARFAEGLRKAGLE